MTLTFDGPITKESSAIIQLSVVLAGVLDEVLKMKGPEARKWLDGEIDSIVKQLNEDVVGKKTDGSVANEDEVRSVSIYGLSAVMKVFTHTIEKFDDNGRFTG